MIISTDQIYVLTFQPIPVGELEVSLPCDQHQFQKATMFDGVPRNSLQYIIMVKHKGSDSKAHMFGSPTYQERKAWMDHIESVLGSLSNSG